MLAWLNALVAPAKTLHSKFLLFSNALRRELSITGQKRVLQYYLNRYFLGDSLIEVYDTDQAEPVFVFTEDENMPVYLPVFITGSAVDFIVDVPLNLKPQETAIRAFVNKYKLVTKRYEIIYHV
jgi:hypothetical protein